MLGGFQSSEIYDNQYLRFLFHFVADVPSSNPVWREQAMSIGFNDEPLLVVPIINLVRDEVTRYHQEEESCVYL